MLEIQCQVLFSCSNIQRLVHEVSELMLNSFMENNT